MPSSLHHVFFCFASRVAGGLTQEFFDGGTIVKIWKWMMGSSMSMAMMAFLGCDVFLGGSQSRREPAYEESEPRYVKQQPQYVVVPQAPPPVIVERRPAPPSEAYVWIDGYWNWDNTRYTWQRGRYVVPPDRDAVWVAPRYDRDTHGYRYSPGQWARQNRGNEPDHNQQFGRE